MFVGDHGDRFSAPYAVVDDAFRGRCIDIDVATEGVFPDDVEVAVGRAVCKVDDFMWIEGFTQESGFKVEVRTCGASGGSSEADGLSGQYDLVFSNEESGEVSVNGFKAVGVSDDEVVTITSTLEVPDSDFPAEGCAHRIAHIEVKIDSAMHPATTYAVI